MLDDEWLKIETVFNAAVLLPTAARSAFITESCGDDTEVCEELNRMMTEDANQNNLLEQPIFTLGVQILGTDPDETPPPTEFSNYKIRRLLGRGGTGAVYLAEDLRLERLIVLKILSAAATLNDEAVLRFQQEARSVSALSHPNIAHIYEFGAFEGQHFLAIEYVPGKTLRELLSEGRLDVFDAVEIALQIAKALASTHQAGIIHRDIKPENVMISENRHVKVLDFGLAKFFEPKNNEENQNLEIRTSHKTSLDTTPGMIIGTTAYMSPEQVRGQPVSRQTDIWSLGVILFELLAGGRPFTGETRSDVQASILLTETPPVGNLAAASELAGIVRRALSKDQAAPYQSAMEIVVELQAARDQFGAAQNRRANAFAETRQTPALSSQIQPAAATVVTAPALPAVVTGKIVRAGRDRRGQERLLQNALDYCENIIAALREPFLVLDQNLRVKTANKSFYQTFLVSSEETVDCLVYELGNRQWDIPALRILLEKVLSSHQQIDDYEVEHVFQIIGRKRMRLNARRIHQPGSYSELLLLAVEDVTESDAVANDFLPRDRLSQEIFDSISSGMAIVDADGIITHVSRSWEFFGRENGAVMNRIGVGINYLAVCERAATTDASAQAALDGIRAVMDGKATAFVLEYPCHSPTERRWFKMQVDSRSHKVGGAVITHTDLPRRSNRQSARHIRRIAAC